MDDNKVCEISKNYIYSLNNNEDIPKKNRLVLIKKEYEERILC